MLPVYLADPSTLPKRIGRVQWAEKPTFCTEWRDFERLASRAPCAVVIDPWLRRGRTLQNLSEFEASAVFHPLIVVTARDPENARLLVGSAVDEIVWLDEVGNGNLRQALQRAESRGLLHRLRKAVDEANHLPRRLRSALSASLDPNKEVTSVSDLGRSAERDRRTIWRWWRKTFQHPDSPTPRQFLDWVVVLRALSEKTPGRSWSQVAIALGVHADTLARRVRRTVDMSLVELDQSSIDVVLPAFLDVFAILLVPSENDASHTRDKLRQIEAMCG